MTAERAWAGPWGSLGVGTFGFDVSVAMLSLARVREFAASFGCRVAEDGLPWGYVCVWSCDKGRVERAHADLGRLLAEAASEELSSGGAGSGK